MKIKNIKNKINEDTILLLDLSISTAYRVEKCIIEPTHTNPERFSFAKAEKNEEENSLTLFLE